MKKGGIQQEMKKSDIQQKIAHKIFMIWFSKNGAPPLGGPINEFRLISHRARFPKDTLSLIVNLGDLTPSYKQYVETFCTKHGIHLISLQNIIKQIPRFDYGDQKVQQELADIAQQEIHRENGCLAAASDIVRVLSPSAALGCYKDFDVIKLSTSESLDAKKGFLLHMELEGVTIKYLNNNVLFCNEKVNPHFLKCYRADMLSRYKSLQNDVILDSFKDNEDNFVLATDNLINLMYKLDNMLKRNSSNDYAAFLFRDFIKAEWENKTYPECNAGTYMVFFRNHILTLSGPAVLNDVFVEYTKKPSSGLRGKGQAALHELAIKMPFVDEVDQSWCHGLGLATNRRKYHHAARTIQKLYRQHKENRSKPVFIQKLDFQQEENRRLIYKLEENLPTLLFSRQTGKQTSVVLAPAPVTDESFEPLRNSDLSLAHTPEPTWADIERRYKFRD